MRRRGGVLFACVAIIAALVPLLPGRSAETTPADFPGWPARHEGKLLRQLPLTALELRFQEAFPGRLGRFSDGKREIILRWVAQETRMLHPAIDCFRGSGYEVTKPSLSRDSEGLHWGRFIATREGKSFVVTERIYDGQGRGWTDVSSWYWAAWWKQSSAPWWAITVAEANTGG
jgi:hypothetical protein